MEISNNAWGDWHSDPPPRLQAALQVPLQHFSYTASEILLAMCASSEVEKRTHISYNCKRRVASRTGKTNWQRPANSRDLKGPKTTAIECCRLAVVISTCQKYRLQQKLFFLADLGSAESPALSWLRSFFNSPGYKASNPQRVFVGIREFFSKVLHGALSR